MENWMDEYINKFKINGFDRREVIECLRKIVYRLNERAKFQGVDLNATLYKDYISLPDCNICYQISNDSIYFTKENTETTWSSLFATGSSYIFIYKKKVNIVYYQYKEVNNPIEPIAFMEFDLYDAIYKALGYTLTNKFRGDPSCLRNSRYY